MLSRSSFNHLTRKLQNQHNIDLPNEQNEIEPLGNYEQHNSPRENISIHLEVPDIQRNTHQNPPTLKTLTLEMTDIIHNLTQWTHVYTNWSSQGAVKNMGGGIYIKYSIGRMIRGKASPKVMAKEEEPRDRTPEECYECVKV